MARYVIRDDSGREMRRESLEGFSRGSNSDGKGRAASGRRKLRPLCSSTYLNNEDQ